MSNKLKARMGRPPKHGGFSVVYRDRLLKERPQIRRYLEEVRAGLVQDIGPQEKDLSTQERILIDRTISALGIARLIEEFAAQNGVFRNGELDPSLGKHYISLLNAIRHNLQSLGVRKRQAHALFDLKDYLKLKEEGKDSGAREIVSLPPSRSEKPGDKETA